MVYNQGLPGRGSPAAGLHAAVTQIMGFAQFTESDRLMLRRASLLYRGAATPNWSDQFPTHVWDIIPSAGNRLSMRAWTIRPKQNVLLRSSSLDQLLSDRLDLLRCHQGRSPNSRHLDLTGRSWLL